VSDPERAPAAAPAAPAARILVVDDEPGVREGVRKILSAEGYDVTVAEDGRAGLEKFEAGAPFAVLLVDLMMPRMSGLELMRAVLERDPDVVPLIITAHATIDTAVEGTRQGAWSYIPKPFTADELLLAIKNGLERRALAREARRLRAERERRMLELALERSRSTTIITAMPDGVLVINAERLVVLRNAAAARIMPECARRDPPFPMAELASEDVREIVSVVLDAPGGFMILSREIRFGEQVFMANVSPILEPDGSTSGAVAVFSDITGIKKLETAKSMFVSMVAHEIKNPLAAAEGWLNLVLTGAAKVDRDEERRMLERAMVRMRTLRAMVNELLNLTAIETGRFQLHRVRVDPLAVAAEVVEAHREKAAEKRVTLSVEGAPGGDSAGGATTVLADRGALSIVIANLVDNAIKYTPEGGSVSLATGREGIYATVSVHDTGIGLSAEDRDRVFEEFYRVRSEQTHGITGTGLGLSLVRRLVEQHQGSISVDSEPGKGSTFTVRLPVEGPP
jgi:two-component system, OmpR family, phosphate regulon sensor histidine kinase PhoR